MKKKSEESVYRAEQLRESSFRRRGHVHIEGNVTLRNKLFVGGNLTVDGNLKAKGVYCLGTIRVNGTLKAEDCVAGVGIDVGGVINAGDIVIGRDGNGIADLAGMGGGDYLALARYSIAELREELDDEREWTAFEVCLKAASTLHCQSLETHGGVDVAGRFVADHATVGADLVADGIYMEGDLTVQGDVASREDINVGDLFCTGVACQGDLECDDITADGGDISALGSIRADTVRAVDGNVQAGQSILVDQLNCGGYIKAGGLVFSSGEIAAGDDYGIFAGLCVPRSRWPEKGYVSAPVMPKNILSGVFQPGKEWHDADDDARLDEASVEQAK